MNAALRTMLLIVALAGFLVSFSFHIENFGPRQTVTLGLNISPWLKWSRVRGVEQFTEKWHITPLAWSALGLPVAIIALVLRSRVKK
jgi:hypothetical protein